MALRIFPKRNTQVLKCHLEDWLVLGSILCFAAEWFTLVVGLLYIHFVVFSPVHKNVGIRRNV